MRTTLFLLPLLVASARASFTCTAEGVFADPDNCENFIQCTRGSINEDGTYDYDKFVNECADGQNGPTLWEACDRVCATFCCCCSS